MIGANTQWFEIHCSHNRTLTSNQCGQFADPSLSFSLFESQGILSYNKAIYVNAVGLSAFVPTFQSLCYKQVICVEAYEEAQS